MVVRHSDGGSAPGLTKCSTFGGDQARNWVSQPAGRVLSANRILCYYRKVAHGVVIGLQHLPSLVCDNRILNTRPRERPDRALGFPETDHAHLDSMIMTHPLQQQRPAIPANAPQRWHHTVPKMFGILAGA